MPTYRDYLGTLGVNLKVAAGLIDEALQDKTKEAAIAEVLSPADVLRAEEIVQHLTEKLRARPRREVMEGFAEAARAEPRPHEVEHEVQHVVEEPPLQGTWQERYDRLSLRLQRILATIKHHGFPSVPAQANAVSPGEVRMLRDEGFLTESDVLNPIVTNIVKAIPYGSTAEPE